MNVTKIDCSSQRVSRWSGGTTTELAICPPGADYADRDFLWRLSSAVVELPESDFTPLPDYDRILMILSGELSLSHDGGGMYTLRPLEQTSFDGASHTFSRGQVTDFNLMLRKGRCAGAVEARRLSAGERWELPRAAARLVYVFEGSAEGIGEKEALLIEDGAVTVRTEAGATVITAVMEETQA